MSRGLGRYLLQRSSDVLNHLGIRDRWGSTTARLTVIHPDDTVLVSMPRSGSNWVRLMLAHLKAPGEDIHFGTINDFVPTLHSWTPCDIDALPRPRIIKTHYAAYRRYPRFLAVVRDPRDVMVSMYHFYISTRYFDSDLPFPRFLRSGYARWP
ncbi:MAG: sulfotransferase domain-containing protein, partial [Solirubrobacterales bacterium]